MSVETKNSTNPGSGPRSRPRRQNKRRFSVFLALLLGLGMLQGTLVATMSTSADAAVGQGFNLNPSDLRFILQQIKIAEQHARTRTPENPCGTLLGTGATRSPAPATGVSCPGACAPSTAPATT